MNCLIINTVCTLVATLMPRTECYPLTTTVSLGLTLQDLDAPFRILLQDLATALTNTRVLAGRRTPGSTTGSYLQILTDMDNSIKVMQRVASGKTVLTGSQCLSATLDVASATGQVLRHANDVIKKNSNKEFVIDDENHHNAVQKLAAAQNAVLKAAVINAKAVNPGGNLKVVLGFSRSMNRVQTVVASGDTSPECVAALKALAGSTSSVLGQLN